MSLEILSTLANGALQANASGQAASAIEEGAKQIGQNAQTYQQQMSPWYNAGSQAISQLSADNQSGKFNVSPYSGNFNYQQSPGYAFQTQQGKNAINSSASARGGMLSGTTMKALEKYGVGQAAQDYNQQYQNYMSNAMNVYNTQNQQATNAFNRGLDLSQQGKEVPGNYATMMNQSDIGQANAKAAGIMGVANAWSGALNAFDPLSGILGNKDATGQAPQLQQPASTNSTGLSAGNIASGVIPDASTEGVLANGGYAGSYDGAAAGVGATSAVAGGVGAGVAEGAGGASIADALAFA